MGAFSFIIYSLNNPSISIDYTNSFIEMKNRGNNSTFVTKHSIEKTSYNEEKLKLELSRDELSKYKQYTFLMYHHRMNVNDLSYNASQPFEDPIIHKIRKYPELRTRTKRMLLCNGEIYNYNDLKTEFTDKDLQSNSDVEVILPLYIKYGLQQTLDKLNGDYSFILTENLETYDLKSINVYIVRDKLGTKPLYRIKHNKDLIYMFVTEIKGVPKFILNDSNYQIDEIPPGTFWSFNNTFYGNNIEFQRYHDWNIYKTVDSCLINSTDPDSISNIYTNIVSLLTKSTIDRYIMSDVQVGILLSGGFDSSILTSIIAKHIEHLNQITVFTIGDNEESKECVEFLEKKYKIDIIHHIININQENFETFILKSINDIIYTLETYDPTTIKGAIPYAFLFDYIQKNTDIKVLITGEGLDELCGYKEFKNLDNNTFQSKSVKLIKNLCKFDLLRADKMAGKYNLEVRHPFLDLEFMKYILSIHPKIKSPQIYANNCPPIEKYIIRKSFDQDNYLPSNILWKTIQDTSHCFGEDRIEEIITKYTKTIILEKDLDNILNTTEKKYYKMIFDKLFGIINGNGTLGNNLNKFWTNLWD